MVSGNTVSWRMAVGGEERRSDSPLFYPHLADPVKRRRCQRLARHARAAFGREGAGLSACRQLRTLCLAPGFVALDRLLCSVMHLGRVCSGDARLIRCQIQKPGNVPGFAIHDVFDQLEACLTPTRRLVDLYSPERPSCRRSAVAPLSIGPKDSSRIERPVSASDRYTPSPASRCN